MSTVSCTDSDKERFEKLQEPDETQAEAMSRILDMAEAFNGEVVDEDELADLVADKMGPKVELSMMRVANEMNDRVPKQVLEGIDDALNGNTIDGEQLEELINDS